MFGVRLTKGALVTIVGHFVELRLMFCRKVKLVLQPMQENKINANRREIISDLFVCLLH